MYKPVESALKLEVSPEVQAMFDWAAAQGVRWPKLAYPVQFPPGYVGAMALEEIHPNERIVTAPNSALMTSKIARECPDLKEFFVAHPEISSRGSLAVTTFLLWEKQKGSDSKWEAFIKYQQRSSNLQDWEDFELDELQDDDLKFDVKLNRLNRRKSIMNMGGTFGGIVWKRTRF
jgi:hypothetical protein